MLDIRLRSQISEEELQQKVGKILTDADYNLLVTRDCSVRRPDGRLLAVFRKGIVPAEVTQEAYPSLHGLRGSKTNNRGLASGTKNIVDGRYGKAKAVASAIVGAFEANGSTQYCRLTAWTGKEVEQFSRITSLLSFIAERMQQEVPDRYEAQMRQVERTDPAWVIPGTPFSTVTVNNTYPTGVHTDRGDLDEGFSNLLAIRQGVTGGRLVWPKYRLACEMETGDLLLMDAHEWHGNTKLFCTACGSELDRYHECGDPAAPHVAERISVVAYYRTNMVKCGTPADESDRQRVLAENRNAAALGA